MKTYIKPTLRVITLQQQGIICYSTARINGNAGFDYGGGGSGPARAPRRRGFDYD